MMRNQSYNEKVDVWSFGMILYELTTNTIPYQHCQIEFLVYDEVIKYNKTPPIPKGIEIDSILHDLMKGCWNWDPQQRPSFSQIVQTLRNALRPPNITHTTATLSQFRSRVAVTSSGELVFFAGGRLSQKPTIGGGPSDRVDIYNVTSGSWTTATLSIPRHDLATTSSQNLVFFGGGEDGPTVYDRVDIYNTLNGSWSTATLSQPRVGLAATSVGNLVLFGGGYNSTGPSNVVDVFNMTNNKWTTATLSQARGFFAATSVNNRYALFAGGYTGSKQYSNVVDIFDSLSGMWNTTTLSQARCDLAATSLGNLAFFGGGKTIKGKELQPSNVVDIFNSTSQTWSNATLSQARYWLAASSIGDIVAFGGGTHDGSTPSSVVDMLNLRSNTWFTRNLSQPRYLLGSTSSTNKIFFGGGSRGNIESGLSNVVDIFEISAS
jgi:hypothetical protein